MKKTNKIFLSQIVREVSEETGFAYKDVKEIIKKTCEVTAHYIFVSGYSVAFRGFFTLKSHLRRGARYKTHFKRGDTEVDAPATFIASVKRGEKYRKRRL